MASQNPNGVDRSATALGLGYNQWTRNDLGIILNHYGVPPAVGDGKNDLMDKLNQLALERGLTHIDRLAIIRAHKTGHRLPPRKPLIRAPVAPPTVAQITATDLTLAQGEEYSSGASDGSDLETSDDELLEELPSLSEEERDLREYTAAMNLPRSSEKRRSVRPRSVATPSANRQISTKPRSATTHPAVRTRSAALNRSATTNRPALPNRSACARTRLSTNTRRSGSAVANLARGGPTTSRRSRYLAQTQNADPTSNPQTTSGPSALKTSPAVNPECTICYTSFDPAKTHMRQPTSSCRHETNVCKPCLSASISTQLDTKVWTRVGCPAPGCEELLEYHDIQALAGPQTFARYFEFTFQAAQADSHFQRCRTPGCKSGQQCFPEDTIMYCRECNKSTCISCDIEMHHGISCSEKAAERQNAQHSLGELATTKYLDKRAKKCPGCSAPTQKTGGCDHIECKWCGREYCWVCLADYGPISEEGNEHHAPDCEYHSDNL